MINFRANGALKVSAALCLAGILISCGTESGTKIEEDKEEETTSVNIVGAAAATADLSSLVTLLKLCKLDGTLSTNTKKTVFAPNNAAFTKVYGAKLPTTCKEDLKTILSYHVVSGKAVKGASITKTEAAVATLAGDVFVKTQSNKVVINNSAKVVTADVEASDGVVHIVDTVLIPDSLGTVVQIAAKRDSFSSLVSLVTLCKLEADTALGAAAGTFTVFAPDNAAFKKYLGDTAAPTTCTDDLKNTLLYHVLGAKVFSVGLDPSQAPVTLLANNKVFVTKSAASGVVINAGAKVTTADVAGSNGVVHVIDTVLVPDAQGDIVAALSKRYDNSDLVAAVVKASLVVTLQGAGPFTVFAPTNAAFSEVASAVAGYSTADLTKVLTHHVLSGKVLAADIAPGDSTPQTVEESTIKLTNTGTTVYIRGNSQTDLAEADAPKVVEADIVTKNGVIHIVDGVLIPTLPTL